MRARPLRRTQLWAVMRKETLQTVRDRRVMFMLIVAPLIQLLVFGWAVDFKVDRVPTAVVDLDRTPTSRDQIRRVLADGTLTRTLDLASAAEAERALERGTAAVALILPHGLSRELARGGTATVQVLIDGSDPNRSTVAGAAAARFFAEYGGELVFERLQARGISRSTLKLPQVTLRPRLFYNPQLDSPPYMIPGVLAMLLVVVTTIVTAMGLAREREMGTLEQVLVTPIRPSVLLLGKMLPFVAIGLFDVALGLASGAWIFQVPLRGNLVVIVVATLLYLMSTLGIGLLISTLSRTQQQSFLGGFLFALPAILLSGIMTPIAGMPGWLRAVTYLNPVRYYIEIMRASLLKDAGPADLWWRGLALLAFGSAILALATARFHKRLA